MPDYDFPLLKRRLPRVLLTLRLSIAAFLLPWVVDKFTAEGTAHTAAVFKRFYHIDGLTETMSYMVGVFWLVVWLAFVTGFKKRISYGLVMIFHGLGTVMTWDVLLPFMPNANLLFLAALPTLGGMVALYALRDYDTIFALDT